MKGDEGYYRVMRTHSSVTSNVTLWKVMSRRMKTRQNAFEWKDFCEGEEKNPEHKFCVVQIIEEGDELETAL